MEWLGFVMVGFIAGVIAAASLSSVSDKRAAEEGIWKYDGRFYRLVPIDPKAAPVTSHKRD